MRVATQLTDDQLQEALRLAIKENDQASALTIGNMILDREDVEALPEVVDESVGDISDLQVEGFQPTERTSRGPDFAGDIVSFASDAGKDLFGLGELLQTVVTGGGSEILAGASNAMLMMFGRSGEKAGESIDFLTEKFTVLPKTKRGKAALEAVTVPLVALEEAADDISWRLSMGNPTAATTIKTSLLGAAELALPSKGVGTRATVLNQVRKNKNKVKKLADDLGIDLHVQNLDTGNPGMMAGIIQLVEKMTPEQRAANMPFLQESIRAAEANFKARKNAAFENAKRTKTYVETRAIKDVSAEVRRNLVDDAFDVSDMPQLQKSLAELDNFGSTDLGLNPRAVNFRELELIRRRTGRRAKDAFRSGRDSEGAALVRTKKEIDGFIDNEFNKIAIEQGQSALTGDVAGVKAWKEARALNTEWHKRFNDDKFISQLIAEDATPETFRQWLMGASTMGANREAASVIQRLRKVLGDEHPAVEGIRQDFLFEVAEPILKDTPNFNQFVRNYDVMVRRNPSLVKELGLRSKDLELLFSLAKVQAKLPAAMRPFHITDVTKAMAQFFVGHKIAKAALRVNVARGLANYFLGVDQIPPKQVVAELAGAMFGEPAIPAASPIAAEFIAGAALTGAVEDE